MNGGGKGRRGERQTLEQYTNRAPRQKYDYEAWVNINVTDI